jgi:hypothetical protein
MSRISMYNITTPGEVLELGNPKIRGNGVVAIDTGFSGGSCDGGFLFSANFLG